MKSLYYTLEARANRMCVGASYSNIYTKLTAARVKSSRGVKEEKDIGCTGLGGLFFHFFFFALSRFSYRCCHGLWIVLRDAWREGSHLFSRARYEL